MNKDQDSNRDNEEINNPNKNNLPHFIKKDRDADKNILKFSDVDAKETEIFLKLLKSWLVKYSNLDTNLTVGENPEEDLITNKKTNFARIKLFVDYFELSLKCLQLTNSMESNFIKFSKFVQNLTKKVLLSSKKINPETTLFTDIILVNYPNIIEKLNSNNFHKIIKSSLENGQIIAFKKAYVIKLKPPTFLLWSKKIFYTCDCKGERGQFSQKFFNIYKTQTEKNSSSGNNVYDSMCSICKKAYIQDKNSDILIECQEISFAIDTESENLVDNMITVWTYGDLINSVKEGDCVSLITFYLANSGKNTYEKDFEYGSFIALNFNMFFVPTAILKEKYFSILQSKNFIEGVLIGNHTKPTNNTSNMQTNSNLNMNMNFSAKFNDNSEIDILRSVNFQRQLNSNLVKFMLQNFIFNKNKNLSQMSNDHAAKYNFFLHVAFDLSIAQRDYLNKTKKSAFMNESELENKSALDEKNKNHFLNSICQSRNLSLKTKIFEKVKKEKIEKNKNQRSQEDELKKHFRLSKQIDYQKYFDCINSSSNHSLMTKPLNIFLIFDDINKENFQILQNYSKNYKNLISIYPFFNTSKFNKENVMRFLITCNNRIVIIPSTELLSKNEIELISSIMNDSNQNSNLNIAFWFCSTYTRLQNNGKKNSNNQNMNMFEIKNKNFENIISKCEIVLNFSKKFNRFRGVQISNNCNKDDMQLSSEKEIKIANFAVDFSCANLEKDYMNITQSGFSLSNSSSTILENKFDLFSFEEFKILKGMNDKEILKNIEPSICRTNHFYNANPHNNANRNLSEELNFDDSFSSAKLMEDYFIIKRKVSNVDFDDLFSILRMSIFSSMLRKNYTAEKIYYPRTISNINYLDVIVTIFLYEEFGMFKYGLESCSFGNTIGKIIHSDLTSEMVNCVNELNRESVKIKECKKLRNFNAKSPMIPKAKSSFKKFAIGFDLDDDYVEENLKNPKDCAQCKRMLNISLNSKMEDFVEKLTIFTYNN